MQSLYTKWRLKIFALTIVIIIVGSGYFLYLELFTPPSLLHIPRTISADAPVQSQPPNTSEKQTYRVPAAHPRRLIIQTLGVDALVKPVGILSTGALDAPGTAWDVGWYTGSNLPGQPGAMVMDGHVNDSFNTPGIFASLKNLRAGDKIEIERGDGQRFHYKVIAVEHVSLDSIDMTKVMRPIVSGKEGLNLITCGTSYNPAKKTYQDRVIVFSSV